MFGKIKEILFSPTVNENKFDSICFNLILFDIFFVPLFPLFSVSISLPILMYWLIRRGKYTKFEVERNNFVLIAFLMALSTLFSFFDFEGASYNTDFITSFKRCVQYLTSFGYFFFFVYFFSNYRRNINNIVFWGIVYIALYAALYAFNQDLFIQIKQTLCPFDPQVDRWLDGTLFLYRFNYLWADPNNVAYATTSLSVFYLIEERENTLKKYIALICLAYITICTMSFGGIGVALAIIGYLFIFSDIFRANKSAIVIGFIAMSIIILYIVYNFDLLYELVDAGIGQRQDAYGSEGMAGGGGRGSDFLSGLKKFNPLFFIVGSGKEGYVTEIGHIYILYMYGLPVYIYFLKILFAKKKGQTWKEYLTIVPVFVGFTMNIAIGEQKYLLITLLISAYYTAKKYVTNLKKISA